MGRIAAVVKQDDGWVKPVPCKVNVADEAAPGDTSTWSDDVQPCEEVKEDIIGSSSEEARLLKTKRTDRESQIVEGHRG